MDYHRVVGRALPVAALLFIGAILLAACTNTAPTPAATPTLTATVVAAPTATATPTATPSPTPAPTAASEEEDAEGGGHMDGDTHEEEEGHQDTGMEMASQEDIAAGQALYVSTGCAACHGQDAEGSAFAPAMAGHSAQQVVTQVRTPLKNMPAYNETRLSDGDLGLIVAYITSLEGGMAHVEPLEMEDVVATHHWMALLALDAGNVSEAHHHVEHIIELVTENDHKHQMEQALAFMEAGEIHEAEHAIEGMLAGTAEPELALSDLHLRLAHTAIQHRDVEEAVHHMEHFQEVAGGIDRIKGQAVLNYLAEMDLHEAGHAVEEMMGLEPHGEE